MRQLYLLTIICALFSSCGGRGETNSDAATGGDTLTLHSTLLTLVRESDGSLTATIANPWQPGNTLQRLTLVHRDSAVPEHVEGTVVRVPVERAGVYSSVHTGGLKELGALPAIAAVADLAYFPTGDTIRTLAAEGAIADLGTSQAPSMERMAATDLEVVLRSPMEGLASGSLPPGIVPIEMADYMETSPIGRAEWLLLLGALTGTLPQADSILYNVINDYSNLHQKAAVALSPKPVVLSETEQSGVWYVPGARSYMARFITDAGGTLPFDDNKATGSVPMSLEAVAARAIDADVWLLRSYGSNPGPDDLEKMNPRYGAFKPVRERNVWSCNSAEVPVFDDIAFHPERLLADYIAIFHPEVLPDHTMNYFQKSK